jgi:signal transduction histidine kinase
MSTSNTELRQLTKLLNLAVDALGCDAAVLVADERELAPIVAGSWPDLTRGRDASALVEELRRRADATVDGELARAGRSSAHVAPAVAAPSVVMQLAAEHEGDRYGQLYLLHDERAEIDVRQARAFAAHCAVALGLCHEAVNAPDESLHERIEKLDGQLLSVDDLTSFTTRLQDVLGEVIGPSRAGVMLWDDGLEALQTQPGFFGLSPASAASYQVDMVGVLSNSARVFASGVPYFSNHPAEDPAMLPEWVDFFRPERIISVPLRNGELPVGVLHLVDRQAPFTLDDVHTLEALSPRIAKVVALVGEILSSRKQRRLERMLSDVAIKVVAGESMQSTLAHGCAAARQLSEAEVVVMTPVAGPPIGMPPPRVARRPHVAAALADAAASPRETAEFIRPTGAGDPGSAHLHLPVEFGSRRVGTLSAVRERAEPFDPYERDALQRLANLAALAWAADGYRQKREELVRIGERHRVADDLHDYVAQILFAAQMRVDSVIEDEPLDPRARETIEHVRSLLAQGDAAIREVIEQLSAPSQDELAERVVALAEGLEDEFELPVRIQVSDGVGELAARLPQSAADALVRVAREALVNAGKHAGPCRALVRLYRRDAHVVLTVLDDGIGAIAAEHANGSGGHGLASLHRLVQEQGGKLLVSSVPDGGVSVEASFSADV